MKKIFILFFILMEFFSVQQLSFSFETYSGRRLARGHYLTCWGGSDSATRRDNQNPPFTRETPQGTLDLHQPSFTGSYSFEVKDTWEEWVTKTGSDCFRCGSETCRDSQGKSYDCGCKTCSWQELETFYRPWSIQKASWEVRWKRDQEYSKKRIEWFKGNRSEVNKENLEELLEFDPDRPYEAFLFPGEHESIQVSNSGDFSNVLFGSATNLNPAVSIPNARHEYNINTRVNGRSDGIECNDHDLQISSVVETIKRKVSLTPNSIEFPKDWLKAPLDTKGETLEEPTGFSFMDTSAMYYENQNIFENYKDTRVQLRLKQQDRAWWFDRFITRKFEMADNISVLKFEESLSESSSTDGVNPPVAEYELSASDLLVEPGTKKQFHLIPGKTYSLCARVYKRNNLYYTQDAWYRTVPWSDYNCVSFTFTKDPKKDLRSLTRKLRDGVTRFYPAVLW